MWWVFAAAVLLCLLVLAVASVPVLRRLPALRAGMASLQARAEQGEVLRVRVEELNGEVRRVQERLAGLRPGGE